MTAPSDGSNDAALSAGRLRAALESLLQGLVSGKRIAMEYSEGNAVPYLDRVPAGMLEMIRRFGATVVSSADLVSEFNATWTPDELAKHRRAAEHVASIAQDPLSYAVTAVRQRELVR